MNNLEKYPPDSDEKLKIDRELLTQIKEMQDLPEDVINNFINVAGSLSKTDFRTRFEVE
jgi:hypothetical protein